MQSLAEIKELLTAGKRAAAKRALLAFLQAEPDNVSAWALLATFLEEPEQQAKCYHHILHLDPDNREAAESLQRLARPSPPLETASSTVQGNMLRCPQCGGTMEVHFVGELRDKRASCPYCGTEVDLPDSYQRIEHHHEQQTDMLSSRTVDQVVVQTRGDGATVPETGQKVLESLFQQRIESQVSPETEELPGCLRWLARLLPGSVTRANVKFHSPFAADKAQLGSVPAGSLGPDADMQLAEGALPPEERRSCPHCGATISKHATRCAWCGAFLIPSEEEIHHGL